MTIKSHVIFCDDIRFEQNGKLIVIGVYSDELVPAYLPQSLMLSAWIALENVPEGIHEVRLRAGFNETISQDVNLTISVPEGASKANMVMTGLPFNLPQEGHIFIRVSGFPDGEIVEKTLHVTEARHQIGTSTGTHSAGFPA